MYKKNPKISTAKFLSDKVVIVAVLLVINIYVSLNFIPFLSCLGLCL